MPQNVLEQLTAILEQRKGADPASSYVAKLYAGGIDLIVLKTGVRDVVTFRGTMAAGDSLSPDTNPAIATLAGEIQERGRHAYGTLHQRGRSAYGEARHRGRAALRRAEEALAEDMSDENLQRLQAILDRMRRESLESGA